MDEIAWQLWLGHIHGRARKALFVARIDLEGSCGELATPLDWDRLQQKTQR